MTIPVGHFIALLDQTLGPFQDITASGAVRFPTGQFIDGNGKLTGEISHPTSHDQVALAGSAKWGQEDVFVTVHCRSGLSTTGPRGRGRRVLQWIIDGEDGTIEVTNREDDRLQGVWIPMTGKDVYINGDKLELEETEVDQLGSAGKAWLEFAKGKYTTIDDAIRMHRVVDAALTSISTGKKITLWNMINE